MQVHHCFWGFAPLQIPYRPAKRTLHRLLKRMGFQSVRAVRKPLLSRTNKQKRLQYARKHRVFNWSKVIFKDEKIFRVRPGGHVRYVTPFLGICISNELDLQRFAFCHWTPSGADAGS